MKNFSSCQISNQLCYNASEFEEEQFTKVHHVYFSRYCSRYNHVQLQPIVFPSIR